MQAASGSIAILGMACEFPGAHSPEELWENVLAGRRFFRKAPPERLPPEYLDPDPAAPGKSYCDQMAVLTGWQFDPVAFRIPPVTFQVTDLAHWLALATARAALTDAGLKLESLDRTRVGVVLGNSLAGEFSRSHNLRFRWPYVERSLRAALGPAAASEAQLEEWVRGVRRLYEARLPEITEDTLAGNMANTIAGRICNYFDFGGGGFTVDGACSSSLLSVVMACNALVQQEVDFAIAGGVDVSLDPFEIIGFAKTRALATDDIRPYDARAQAMLTGEGCGILVLAREEVARAAGWRIRALIHGWGYSSDGAGGITAPEVAGQVRALRMAYDRAGYGLGSVGYVEGHGTGTALGDKVELTALRKLLDESGDESACWIGSIKANIGHCKAAAGAAGLIKATLALERKVIPPTVNCTQPSPVFGSPLGRLRPSSEGRAWDAGARPRRAAVSAMGFGGANSHVTLEEANPDDRARAEDLAQLGSAQSTELIALAAETPEALRRQVEMIKSLARRLCRAELTDLSAALSQASLRGRLRLALVADAPWTLAASLESCARKLAKGEDLAGLDDPAQGVYAGVAHENPILAGLFPGQGSQRLNMGAHWLRRFPFVRALFEQVNVADGSGTLGRLRASIFRDLPAATPEARQHWEEELRDTRMAQPALVLSSLATLQVLDFFGLHPHLAVGHSVGEISALAAAGFCEPLTAVRWAAWRGEAMASLAAGDGGGMVAVAAPAEVVQRLLEPFGADLVISNYNSPRQTVVSGLTPALERLRQLCADRRLGCRFLAVSHAFHSRVVAPAADDFRAALTDIGRPETRRNCGSNLPDVQGQATIISTVTGAVLPTDLALADYLADQIRQPVRFIEAVLKAAEQKPALWLEIGPGGVLTGLVRDIFGPLAVQALPTDLPQEDGFHLLNQVLGRAWVFGFPVRLDRLFAHRFHRPLDPENHNPVLIVNPCERTISTSDVMAEPLSGPAPHAAAEAGASSPAKRTPGEPNGAARSALLPFALEWISKRTGFPASAIGPDKKLRDDLNLDSIKVGELVVLLTHELGRRFEGDPGSLANATVAGLVESVLHGSVPVDETKPRPPTASAVQPAVEGLAEWVRTFHLGRVPVPLVEAPNAAPLGPGAAVIVGEPSSPRTLAIAERLREHGLRPLVSEATSLLERGEAPTDLRLLVILLPEQNQRFFEATSQEFDERVENTAATLFGLFRWAGHGVNTASLRGLVLRAAPSKDDPAPDLDGGAGFLKSLGLEYPEANFKWLTLPAEWVAEQWANVALAELQAPRDGVAFAYSADGQRVAEVATLMSPSEDQPANRSSRSSARPLGPEDVVLVSGGAKGITAELALAWARHTKASFVLLGTTPLPEANSPEPENELLRNLRRFDALGVRHVYCPADVTDLAAVRAAVLSAECQLGPITAVLHGAGVTELRAFRDKDLAEFLRCVRIKARGLYNLLAAVPPARLKALHVVSSVLGHTGMAGQADYTLANAWLDGAVRAVQAAHPHVHCLSLGFTAWAETGLARKVGAVENLQAIGVTPLRNEEGTSRYLELLDHSAPGGVYVITGRLTAALETHLFRGRDGAKGRFLERIRAWVPGVELIADAVLSHETDLYLPEHVFDGTPVFPAVMALEAMVQAATACLGRTDLPEVHHVHFHQPLIVPEGAQVVMRTLVLAGEDTNGVLTARVAIRSDRDGFKQNHFEAECRFGSAPNEAVAPPPQPWPEPLDTDPEQFHPVPLFQGKFFRRIQAVRKLAMGDESVTDIRVPVGESYYDRAFEQKPLTPSPAVRDASLQSGALILPPGCLPTFIESLRFAAQPWRATEQIVCHARVRRGSAPEFVVDLELLDERQAVLETVQGLRLKQSGATLPAPPPPRPLPLTRLRSDLEALLPNLRHAVALVAHSELSHNPGPVEIVAEDRQRIAAEVPPPRQLSRLANLVAARRAALSLPAAKAQRAPRSSPSPGPGKGVPIGCEGTDHEGVRPEHITLTRRRDGKPELRTAERHSGLALEGLDVSLADSRGWSVAWLAPASAGVDLEFVEKRDAETWRGLLGDDGYALALRVAAHAAEPFDRAATRVWTLIEAGKKAMSLRRLVPCLDSSLGGPWLLFVADPEEGSGLEMLSTLVELDGTTTTTAALALSVLPAPPVEERSPLAPGLATSPGQTLFDSVLTDFVARMRRLAPRCINDPEAAGTEERHVEFLAAIEAARSRLQEVEASLEARSLAPLRGRFREALLPFLEGSRNFRHTVLKPLGYAGDFQLLAMLADNACSSRGLAWHFDKSQLDYPASEACRHRIDWILGELRQVLERGAKAPLTILDLGIGAAPIEERLARLHPEAALRIDAVDLEPAALDHVERALAGGPRVVRPWRLNLREAVAMPRVGGLAAEADVCIAVGLLEALSDAEARQLLRTVLAALPAGAVLFTENFLPDHPTRLIMEWFQDFHLAYRSAEQLRNLALEAGAAPASLHFKLDATGSLALLKVTT